MKKQICILGSTGSIGTQALEVIAEHKDLFEVYCLTANNRVEELAQQARRFKPDSVVIANENLYTKLCELLADCPNIKVYAGKDAINEIVQAKPIDIVLTAMVGFAGLTPTIKAIEARKKICLANKETLVVAGELICNLANKYRVDILPVDSEHSAIFQCLAGEGNNAINKILLTASGGPFRLKSIDELSKVTKTDALNHPTWNMGAKITIDSATMMNKGFEVIEAKWLFGVDVEKIEVLVHPQSIVHSAVEFVDGSVKAQLGVPDMRLPIQYAFTYPNRLNLSGESLNLFNRTLEFFPADLNKFRCLAMAYESSNKGGNMPCILNAANEVANEAFRNDKCSFLDIATIVEKTMNSVSFDANPSYDNYIATDAEARIKAKEFLK